jgi:beta-mannosidase
MSRRIVNLGLLDWQVGQAARQPFRAAPVDDRAVVREWLPARIPGDVRADLIAAGRIPPVETPEGIAAGAWVDDSDWWYRAEIPGGFVGLADDVQVILEADGIDYYSAIWLDDRLLATHAGMFSRQTLVLSPWINTPDRTVHELAIRIWGGGALPKLPNGPGRRAVRWLAQRVSPGVEYFPDRMATPKAQFSFGWDFSPRLLSAGIWDDVRLVIARGAAIEDLQVLAEPLTERDDPTPARLHVRLSARQWRAGQVEAEVKVEVEDKVEAEIETGARVRPLLALHRVPLATASVSADPNLSLSLSLDLASVRRWWPWDQGEPCLYRVTVRLLAGDDVLDELSQVIGVRSVRRAPLPDGAPWQFVVNGRPVFLRGANWVPADVLPGRVTEADYERLLGQAHAAGINFLRVWGGGVREKRAFWELCDRLGIMAWQEFPLACAFLDHYPRDADYLATLAQEVRSTARLLRNHPSLIAWCGGNEIGRQREAQPLAAIEAVLAAEDPGRIFIPASPSDGDVHQWKLWHGFAPWTSLAEEQPPFMSEFGLQALPNLATVSQMFSGHPPRLLSDPRWRERKAQAAKLQHYANPPLEGDLGFAVAASQRAQMTALQVGIEAARLRRSECGGVVFWQLNEPWPAVTWSVIDRAGRPKSAYEMLRHSFQPLLIAARFPWRRYAPGDVFEAEIWLVNDSAEAYRGCRARASLDYTTVWTLNDLGVAAGSATRVGAFAFTLDQPAQSLTLRLSCDGAALAANRYRLASHLTGPSPLRSRVIRWAADRLVGG